MKRKAPTQTQPTPTPKKAKKISLDVQEHNTEFDEESGSFNVPTIKEFDFKLIQPDYTIVAFGKRRTGKSFMFRWILSMMAHYFPFVMVFTNTKSNGFWQKHIPDRFIHRGYNAAIVKKFLQWQSRRKIDPKFKDANLKALIIEDDVISDPKLRYSKEQNALFTEGRHSEVCVMVTSQAAKGINPTLRENADVAFFFYMHSKNQKDSIYQDYFDFLPRDHFEALWEKYTANNYCLVVVTDPKAKCFTGNPLDCLFYAKAQDPGDFLMGCEELWKGQNGMAH